VRINVQLIDARTDEHLWAETYDRELSAANIFAIQSEIAATVADALQATLTSEDQARLESVPTDNLEALEAYFVGKQLADLRTEEDLLEAVEKLQLAVELDPDFALAYAGLSYAWVLLPEYSATIDRDLVRERAESAASRALALDSELPEALTVSAWNRLIHDYDWSEAERLLREAVTRHATNADALHWLSHVVSWQGRHSEALELASKAVESDPLSPLMHMNLSYILMDGGQFEEAANLAETVLTLRPDYPELWRNQWLTHLRAARPERAMFAMSQWAAGTGRDLSDAEMLGQLISRYFETGEQVDLPSDLLDTLELGPENLGQVYAAAGDGEAALAALEEALEERSGSRSVLSMKINPLYDFMRDDQRFQNLLKRVNLSP
jgi:tetratricopeptide (TPR) repeat protein